MRLIFIYNLQDLNETRTFSFIDLFFWYILLYTQLK